ncbi:hypothetical protein JAO29_02950 [Edaphobacter sp. HDX4]|uniref:hypothetical protein n=1 Tax=Edaphobacter sp. HDX4 TaxID=2794064 RepID=UPI002FE5AD01
MISPRLTAVQRHRYHLQNFGVGGLVLAHTGTNAQAREDDLILNDRWIISPTF